MNNIVAIKPGIGHNRTPEEWRSYIGEATEMERQADQSKVQAIIEKGKRIAEFHEFYNKQKETFDGSWADVCKSIAGSEHNTCAYYERVAETFCDNVANSFLPPDVVILDDLARALKASRKTFDDAVEGGEINPSMSRDQAKAVARRAAAADGDGASRNHPQIIALAKAGHTPTQIARKLGHMTGNPRKDRNAGVRVARELRKLGISTGSPSKHKGKKLARRQATGFSMEKRGAEIRAFWDGQPKGEEREGLDPSQRVHLFAFTVKQMLDAQEATHTLSNSVLKTASDHAPSAERFCELIDQMLAWQPDKSRKGTGWDTDFAAKAKKTLDSLDKHLDKAVERLIALQALIRARKG